MAPHEPPFDFDLNEPPPPENDGVNGISAAAPVLEPSAQQDPLPPALVREPSPQQDPLPKPSTQQDPLPPAPVPEPPTAHVPLSARSLAPAPPEPSPDDPLPALPGGAVPHVPSPDEPLPAPPRAAMPVPSPRHPPSPVLDLEAPLSPLDDEDEDEADLPLPPPPPLPLPPPPPLPPSYRVADTSDGLTVSSGRHGDAALPYSSPETWAPRGSRAAASDTASSPRSWRKPYSCDDAIPKQRRVDEYDEDGGGSSSRSGSRRSEFGCPRRYERSGGLTPPRHRYYGQDGRRRAPAADGQPGAPSRDRRRPHRAQRPQHGFQYEGPVQKQQGFRGQERPQVHHGPRGPEVPKVGYASYNPEQEPGNGWYHRQGSRAREAPPPFRPSSRPHDHHREREAPSFRPASSGAHVRDGGSSGRRHVPEEKPITGGAHHQQTNAPRGGRDEQFLDRAYHPYARRSGFDRLLNAGRNPVRREPRDNYEHRRYSKQELRSGGPARGRQYYGDVQQ